MLNGIDERVWDPARDPHLPQGYAPDDLSGKAVCKAHLQREAGLAVEAGRPLLGVVSRLVGQKGLDWLVEVADRLIGLFAQLVVLGTGDRCLEEALGAIARRNPDNCAVWLDFDERRAHLIEAGCDLFVMPSRYEPCGLNQMYSQRYGTLPIVRATGGLADTVQNFDAGSASGTGFVFCDPTAEALYGTIKWAVGCYREQRELFDQCVRRVMRLDHSWRQRAGAYEYLYRRACVRRAEQLRDRPWGAAHAHPPGRYELPAWPRAEK